MTNEEAHAAINGELIVHVEGEHGDWKVTGVAARTVDVWRWWDKTKLVAVPIDRVYLKNPR